MDKIPVIRHLEDIDNLKKFDRNPPIKEGQEKDIENFAKEIIQTLKDVRVLLFISSDKLRCLQTAKKIKDYITQEIPNLKIIISENNGLSNIDNGEINLPKNYKEDDFFLGFKLASKIFNIKVFEEGDLLYKFGDSYLGMNSEGLEMTNYFKQPGSNYKEFLLSFLKSILEFSNKMYRFKEKIRPVIITHSQQYQMLCDLYTICEDILNKDLKIPPGEIYKECWSRYKNRITKYPSPIYEIKYIDTNILTKTKIIQRLEIEIEALKSLN